MSWLSDLIKGKEKTKTFTQVAVSALEIVDTDVLEDTKQKLILKYVQKNMGSKDYVMDYGNTGAAQFFQYYLGGIYDFEDRLPSVIVGATGVPMSRILPILYEIEGTTDIEIKDFKVMFAATFPIASGQTQQEIAHHMLSMFYTYDIATRTMGDGTSYEEYIYNVIDRSISQREIILQKKGTSDAANRRSFFVKPFYQSRNYYLVSYYVPSKGITKGWAYDYNIENPSNYDRGIRYPVLDVFSADAWAIGTGEQMDKFDFYPVVTIRSNKHNVTDYIKTDNPFTEQRYKETIAMLNNLGVSLDDVTDAIMKDTDSGGASIASKVRDVYLSLGVSPANEAPIVSRYLFNFFKYIYDKLPMKVTGILDRYTLYMEESNYNSFLEWIPSDVTYSNEVIGPIGTYTHSIVETDLSSFSTKGKYSVIFIMYNGWVEIPESNEAYNRVTIRAQASGPINYSPVVNGIRYNLNRDQVNSISNQSGGGAVGWLVDATLTFDSATTTSYSLVLKRQVTDTTCEIMTLTDLKSQVAVQTGTAAQSMRAPLSLKEDETNSAGNSTGKKIPNFNFLVPLNVKLVENLSFMERTDLLSHCLHLNCYASSTQVVKYREGGILKTLLKIVGIIFVVIISIIAPGAGSALVGSLLSGASSIGLSTVLGNLFVNFLIGMALSVALKIIIKVTGNETLQLVLSAFVMVAAMYIGGGFDGALDSLTGGLKTAIELAEIPFKILDIYANNNLQESLTSLSNLQSEATAYFDRYKEYADRYTEILKQFDSGVSTEFLVELQTMGTSKGTDINPWLLSPSAFLYGAVQSQFALDSLFVNDVETYASRALSIGILDI